MSKIDARYHSPVVVITSSESGKLFMARYDSTYPFVLYRNSFNPFGGNPTIIEREQGFGPLETLTREIKEEIDPNYSQSEEWVNPLDILSLQNNILSNLRPVIDLYINAPQVEGGRPAHKFIYSVFQSKIPESSIEVVEKAIKCNKKLVTEGNFGVTNLNNLKKGEDQLAHTSALIFKYLFNDREGFPCLVPGATAEPLGNPRNSYKDYTEVVYDNNAFKE